MLIVLSITSHCNSSDPILLNVHFIFAALFCYPLITVSNVILPDNDVDVIKLNV